MKTKSVYVRVFTLLFFQFLLLSQVFAQVSINDIKGNKLRNTEGYEGIEGSPYFNAEWLSGEIIFTSGKQAKMDFLKYDMLEDRIFFSDEGKKVEYNFTEPIAAFTLRGAVFQNGFPSIGNFNKDNYFQVIGKGRLTLLKKEENVIGERIQMGLPSSRYFKKMLRYYIYDGEKMIIIKPDAKSLAEILSKNKGELEKYAKDHNLSFKDDVGLKAVFENFSK